MTKNTIIIAVILVNSISGSSQSLTSILDSCYRKHGGLDKWLDVNTIEYSFNIKSRKELIELENTLPKFKQRVGHAYKRKVNNLVYSNTIYIDAGGDSISLGINEINTWVHKKGFDPIVTKTTEGKMKWESMGDAPLILCAEKKKEALVKIINGSGIETTCHRIKLYLSDSETIYYINSKTYLIEGFANESENNVTIYSDYREIAGMLIPFCRTTKKDGELVIEIRYTGVSINEPISTDLFKPPSDKNILIKSRN